MTAPYRTQQRQNIFLSRGALLLLVVLILFIGKAVWNIYIKEQETRQRLEQVQGEHNELLERSEFLEYEIQRLSTDTGREGEIREQYGLAREGERVFVIIEPDETSATTTESTFWDRIFFWRD